MHEEPLWKREDTSRMRAEPLQVRDDTLLARAEPKRTREDFPRIHEPLRTHELPRTHDLSRAHEPPRTHDPQPRMRELPIHIHEEPLQTPPKTEFKDWRTRREERLRREREWSLPSPEKYRDAELVVPGVTDAGDVTGIPGRLRLSKDTVSNAPTSPLPSSRLTRGLWADVQRHLIQAYEYLCHVGEAQQWIEGCLGEELGFGVVEMEEGLRNGVVLARLVRVFQGEASVRRIYEVNIGPADVSLLY